MNQENYNETVLIPALFKKVQDLTSALILAETNLEIAKKQMVQFQDLVNAKFAELTAANTSVAQSEEVSEPAANESSESVA